MSQHPVQENLGAQSQNNQGLNAISYVKNEDAGPALVGVQEEPKKGKGCKKSKTEGMNASDEQNQGSNAHAQTKTTSKVPKTKATSRKTTKNLKVDKSEPKNSNDEGEEEYSP
ncbi:MAG: hypothetical protein EZS28_011697 [Streblomastix strix]|uniref:Uncharacterized protein n=1 Tax=Streblomastix strix TaxID=222440 RepID=A0A5J4WCU0_9EUKA|nr:MAG: hypothetical protein EZS28_011697 [Streblomastix strix]